MKNKTLKVPRRYIPKEGQSSIYIHSKQEYCIVNLEGELHAIDNLCPHQSASLGLGEIKGDEIICPLHQYRFNLKTGACNIEKYGVSRYTVEVSD